VDWTIYGTLIAGFVAIAAGLGFLAVRLLDTWRTFKRFRRRLGKELDRVSELADTASDKAARSGEQPKLEASLRRLRVALTQLAVLRDALDEVDDTFGRVVAVYPRK
jgi:hypothetical protein